jgi:hypothetical protein
MTVSKMTLNISVATAALNIIILSISIKRRFVEDYNAECHIFIAMLNGIMSSVIVQSVVAPSFYLEKII